MDKSYYLIYFLYNHFLPFIFFYTLLLEWFVWLEGKKIRMKIKNWNLNEKKEKEKENLNFYFKESTFFFLIK